MILAKAMSDLFLSAFAGAVGGVALDAAVDPSAGWSQLLTSGAAGAVLLSIIFFLKFITEERKRQQEERSKEAEAREARDKMFSETVQMMHRDAREAHETCTNLLLEAVRGNKL